MPNEETLLQQLSENIHDSFSWIVQGYKDRLFRLACYRLQSVQDAEDIVQEAFVRAYNALRSYPRDRIEALHLKPWLYSITENIIRNHKRDFRAKYYSTSLDQLDTDAVQESDKTYIIDEADAIQYTFAHLSPQYKTCLELQALQGYTQQEIADTLNISRGSVGSYVKRGRTQFRQQYDRAAE